MAISKSKLSKKFLGDWVMNAYIGCEHACRHCYCPTMPGNRFQNGNRSQRQWGEYLIAKPRLLEKLARDLRGFPRPGSEAGGGHILVSFLCDPYTPAEAEHCGARGPADRRGGGLYSRGLARCRIHQ